MNVLIVDDDILFSKKLYHDFDSFFRDKNEVQKTDIVSTDFENIKYNNYDIIFMDINLIYLNGIDLSKKIKESKENLILIFVSSQEELVFRSLEVSPFQFIRKTKYDIDCPLVFNQLEAYLNLKSKSIILDIHGRMIKIDIQDIIVCVAIGHDITIHTLKEDYTIRNTIKGVSKIINHEDFIQVQRGLIVNLRYIDIVENNKIILQNTEEYEIGRKYRLVFKDLYRRYLLR